MTAPAPPGRPHIPAGAVITVVTMATAVQPVATDLYLPALPAIRDALGAPVATVQLTLSVLMIAFGLSQLFFGPATDRFGRRPVLIFGLALYGTGALLGCVAPSIEILLWARGGQGVGMAAIMVSGRALMRDLYDQREGTQVMTRAMSVLSLISMSAPVLGAVLATHLGWRATLAAPALFALALFLVVHLRIPETAPGTRVDALRLVPLLLTYAQVARHRTFLAWASLNAFGYGANFAFFSASSYLYIERFEVSRLAFSLVLGGASGAYLVGIGICRRLIARYGITGAVRRAGWITLAAAAVLIVPQVFNAHTPWTLAIGLWLHLLAYGTLQPCGQIGLVSPFRQQAGAAAALGGFAFAFAAFASSSFLGAVFREDAGSIAWTTGILMAICGVISQTLVQRIPPVLPQHDVVPARQT